MWEYLEMETEGEPQVVEYAETFDVPGGIAKVYVGADENDDTYWIVKGGAAHEPLQL